MDVPTTLERGVRSVANDYDAACKRLLSEKQILSRVLHDWLDEFSKMEPQEIERECLKSDPRIGIDPVGRDEAALGRVAALAGEDSTLSEGTTTFDVRFEAIIPNSKANVRNVVRIEIDVEAQNDFHPGYPLLKRGVFYCGRLLSLQGDNVIPGSHYERVRKVVSIWVCAHPPRKYAGTVTKFSLCPQQLVGSATYRPQDFGLLEVVMVCLNDRDPGSSVGALGMLEVLLSTSMSASTKLTYLEDLCGIVMSENLSERVVGMCNLSQGAIEEGYRKGLKAGKKDGRKEGRAEGRKEGRAEGRKEGRKEGRAEERDRFLAIAASMVSDGTIALQEAIARFGFTEQELQSVLS